MNKRVLIIGNDKGGVGKDLVAEALHVATLRANIDHQMIELEGQKRLGHL